MDEQNPGFIFSNILIYQLPRAVAKVYGDSENNQLKGIVKFYDTPYGGILIEAEIYGLSNWKEDGASNFYGMHIHEYGDCTRPFDKTGDHYNPQGREHPNHAGDLLPLMGNQGYAWSAFYNHRIRLDEIIGKSLVVHNMPDDFKTQPSGNSGKKIGCGVIEAMF